MPASLKLVLPAIAAVAILAAASAAALACDGGDDNPPSSATASPTVPTLTPTTAQSDPTANPTETEPTPTTEPSPTAAPTAESAPALSEQSVLTAEYDIPDLNARARFQDGVHHWVRQPGQSEAENPAPLEPADNWVSRIDPGLIATGDLDGDGAMDAVAVMRSQFGGSGVFVTLVALHNEGGEAQHVATAPLGDRVVVNAVTVTEGEVALDMLTHADPGSPRWQGQCCPNVPAEMRFRLQGSELVPVQ